MASLLTTAGIMQIGATNIGLKPQKPDTSEKINWKTGDGYPKPPNWNDEWEWRYGTRGSTPRWFDQNGGEWRYHYPDKYHTTEHWDYNPWNIWNDEWQNVDHNYKCLE